MFEPRHENRPLSMASWVAGMVQIMGLKTIEIYPINESMPEKVKACCLISSELPVILRMCDRTQMLNEGRITGEVSREDADQEVLMKLMTKEEVG